MVIILGISVPSIYAQPLDPADTTMGFVEYTPVSTLKVPEHPIPKAKYPFIDVHSHHWFMSRMDLSGLIEEMEKMNMGVMVNLSGKPRSSQEMLEGALKNVSDHYPNRFAIFTNVNFNGIDHPNWGEEAARILEEDVKLGAKGLKIFKSLGFTVKDSSGNRIAVDDPRIDPVWAKCGELGIPVLIHSADPAQFWLPRDRYNERWFELIQRPGRYRDPQHYPSWQEIINEQHRVFKKHPGTKFINAHLGWYGNDLETLGKLMDEIPNMYSEIGAVLAELGRQPRNARKFLIKYQDRIMFGKDSWRPEEYPYYFRTLETDDEYFDYYRKRHAHWKIYGLDLPDEVLKKLYYKNALSVIPGLDKSIFPD